MSSGILQISKDYLRMLQEIEKFYDLLNIRTPSLINRCESLDYIDEDPVQIINHFIMEYEKYGIIRKFEIEETPYVGVVTFYGESVIAKFHWFRSTPEGYEQFSEMMGLIEVYKPTRADYFDNVFKTHHISQRYSRLRDKPLAEKYNKMVSKKYTKQTEINSCKTMISKLEIVLGEILLYDFNKDLHFMRVNVTHDIEFLKARLAKYHNELHIIEEEINKFNTKMVRRVNNIRKKSYDSISSRYLFQIENIYERLLKEPWFSSVINFKAEDFHGSDNLLKRFLEDEKFGLKILMGDI